MDRNTLLYGDNLVNMKAMAANSIDLIYLDPPFNSQKNYNLLYKNMTGRPVPEQVTAFCDAWQMDSEKEQIARTMPLLLKEYQASDEAIAFWQAWIPALRSANSNLLAYLVYMTIRLYEMRRILKDSGSIYFHCDPTASHYIKIIMDSVFGQDNFRNEIVWCYRTRPQSKRHFGKKHDVILFYSKQDHYYFDWQSVARPLSESTIKKYRLKDESGRLYRLHGRGLKDSPIKSSVDIKKDWETEHPELVVRDYLDDKIGVALEDWWEVDIINQSAKERLGYPTQKPIVLLDRIIKASCPENGVVFDPFCGCGTTIYAAHLNNRNWIGCDIAILSVRLIQKTLKERYSLVEQTDYQITGIPITSEQAEALHRKDPFQFEHWAVELANGFIHNKKTGDKGIDGRLYFETFSSASGKMELASMVLSVKGGKNIKPTDIRDLRGVLEREYDIMAGYICLHEPTKKMQEEAASAGMFEDQNGNKYERLQIRTIQQLLDGEDFHTPTKVGIKAQTNKANLLKLDFS